MSEPTYWCKACGRGDLPRTTEFDVDATARDHMRLWHPGEWFEVDWSTDEGIIYLVPTALPGGES